MKTLEQKIAEIAARHKPMIDAFGKPVSGFWHGKNAYILPTESGYLAIRYDDDGRIVRGRLPAVGVDGAGLNMDCLYGVKK